MSYTYKYPKADNAVDMVIFTIDGMALKVLLVRRGKEPFKNYLALPGGFVDVEGGEDGQGESLFHAAGRELEEETGLTPDQVYMEQLYTFGDPGRDPRGRVISVAHYALIPPTLISKVRRKGGDDAVEAGWHDVVGIKALAFDHMKILDVAVERIRGKCDYEPQIVINLLPEEFTQAEFRRVHEIVKGVKFDRSNFNKRFHRMLSDGRIVKTGKQRPLGGRHGVLYRIVNA